MSLSSKQKEKQSRHASVLVQSDFDARFNQYWERICEILYRLVGDWAEAEDLALETFMRLHQRPPRRDDNISGWLYRVATNLGYNALRARKRRRQYEDQAGMILIEENSSSQPEMTLEKVQERESVRLTLSKMKPRSAKLLILRHSGLKYAEIAAVLKLSPGSVGTLLSRAEREFEEKYK